MQQLQRVYLYTWEVKCHVKPPHLTVYPCGLSLAPSVREARAAYLCDLPQVLCVLGLPCSSLYTIYFQLQLLPKIPEAAALRMLPLLPVPQAWPPTSQDLVTFFCLPSPCSRFFQFNANEVLG